MNTLLIPEANTGIVIPACIRPRADPWPVFDLKLKGFSERDGVHDMKTIGAQTIADFSSFQRRDSMVEVTENSEAPGIAEIILGTRTRKRDFPIYSYDIVTFAKPAGCPRSVSHDHSNKVAISLSFQQFNRFSPLCRIGFLETGMKIMNIFDWSVVNPIIDVIIKRDSFLFKIFFRTCGAYRDACRFVEWHMPPAVARPTLRRHLDGIAIHIGIDSHRHAEKVPDGSLNTGVMASLPIKPDYEVTAFPSNGCPDMGDSTRPFNLGKSHLFSARWDPEIIARSSFAVEGTHSGSRIALMF